jgi:hypothetical protein
MERSAERLLSADIYDVLKQIYLFPAKGIAQQGKHLLL